MDCSDHQTKQSNVYVFITFQHKITTGDIDLSIICSVYSFFMALKVSLDFNVEFILDPESVLDLDVESILDLKAVLNLDVEWVLDRESVVNQDSELDSELDSESRPRIEQMRYFTLGKASTLGSSERTENEIATQ